MTVPTLAELKSQGVYALDITCQNPQCRHEAKEIPLHRFGERDSVFTVASRAVCSVCECRQVVVNPRWSYENVPGAPRAMPGTTGRSC